MSKSAMATADNDHPTILELELALSAIVADIQKTKRMAYLAGTELAPYRKGMTRPNNAAKLVTEAHAILTGKVGAK